MGLDDLAFDILNEIIVPAIAHAGPEPRKKLPENTFVIGPGFGDFLAGDLDIEILGAGQAQHGGQIDGWSRVRRLGLGPEKHTREKE